MIPGALILELTESVFALEGRTILERLNQIREMGVQIAIDDFGTGYSSLSYLQQFEIHELKVDKSFVDGLGSADPEGGALAHAIVSMAHSLRLEVVAEGIEESSQRGRAAFHGLPVGAGVSVLQASTARQNVGASRERDAAWPPESSSSWGKGSLTAEPARPPCAFVQVEESLLPAAVNASAISRAPTEPNNLPSAEALAEIDTDAPSKASLRLLAAAKIAVAFAS